MYSVAIYIVYIYCHVYMCIQSMDDKMLFGQNDRRLPLIQDNDEVEL